jgi:hypothetical protein
MDQIQKSDWKSRARADYYSGRRRGIKEMAARHAGLLLPGGRQGHASFADHVKLLQSNPLSVIEGYRRTPMRGPMRSRITAWLIDWGWEYWYARATHKEREAARNNLGTALRKFDLLYPGNGTRS